VQSPQQSEQSPHQPGHILVVNKDVRLYFTKDSRFVQRKPLFFAWVHWPKEPRHWTFSGAGRDRVLRINEPGKKGWYKWKTPDKTETEQDRVQLDIEDVGCALARQIEMWNGNLGEVCAPSLARFARMRLPYWPSVAGRGLGLLHRYVL
jgi:hypothetical protein